jgi:hypothetical protein
MNKRARNIDAKTWEEFMEMDSRDQGTGQPDYGQQVRRCIERADIVIENNGNIEEFQAKIDEFMRKILNG